MGDDAQVNPLRTTAIIDYFRPEGKRKINRKQIKEAVLFEPPLFRRRSSSYTMRRAAQLATATLSL